MQADGSIHVSDPRAGGVFRIRELRAEPAASRTAAPAAASARAERVEEVSPSAAPAGRIGRAAHRVGAATAAPGSSAEDVLAELFDRVADLGRERSRDGGLAFLLDLAMEKVDAESGSAFVARLGGRELEFAVARGPRSKELLALRSAVPVGVGIVGFCAQEDVCLAVSDAERDPRFHRAISEAIGYETRSILCAPIARKGRVLGALEVLNKRGGGPFDAADLAVLSYLAHQAAAFLDAI